MTTKRDAGRLSRTVAFDRPIESPDGVGGREDGWLEEFRCSAGFTRLRGGESVMASRLEGKQPTIIRVHRSRRTDDITTDWWARVIRTGTAFDDDGTWSGEVFNVRSRVETEDRQFIDLMCESGVAA